MNLRNIKSSSVSLILASGFLLAVGANSENGGIQMAGGILLVVGLISAFNQARGGPTNEELE